IQQLAPQLGGTVGGAFGQPQLGGMLGNLAGQLGGMLPFAAGPQLMQQQPPPYNPGIIGVGSPFGQLSSLFGQQRPLSSMISDYPSFSGGSPLGSMLPFAAGPQFIPQGAVGHWLSQLAPGLGGVVGGAFGQPQLGGVLGHLAGQLGGMLP